MREPNDSCHLTIVATARNDDHGGNLLRRLQLFVTCLLQQCSRHNVQSELVLVEWNPPEEKPRLMEALRWPPLKSPCRVRIIEVLPEIHGRFQYSERLPLFQMIAKNVGIRRAKGRFVLATNVDILFSDELMGFLGSGRLREGRMYRVDRYDVPADIPLDSPIEAQIDYCREHVIRINERERTRNLLTGHIHTIYPAHTWRSLLRERGQECALIPVTDRSRLHTNACGDFTLMARKHWFDVRGYPEFEMYSLHLDSVLCHAAHHAGAREQVLEPSMRIYHLEHAAGSGWTPEGKRALGRRLSASGVPQLDHAQFDAWAIDMRRERRPMIFNRVDWGLANDQLPERMVEF